MPDSTCMDHLASVLGPVTLLLILETVRELARE